jgi:phosphonate metabolism protein (transferase hexapeptide repeat family)
MVRLGEEPTIHETARVIDCRLGRYIQIGEGTHMLNVDFGDYSYTARFADIANSRIDKFANIAAFVRINPGNHPTWRASLHHFMYRSAMYWDDAENEDEFFEWRQDHACEIGADTWIGHNATVLAGRKVGTGAVVGAGAVVSRDIPPYSIAAGVPAEVVRRRFEPRIADRLQALAWWNWDHGRLRGALADFRSLSAEAFLEKYHG